MAKTRVKNSHLHFNGKNYFRGNSENIILGAYGKKKTSVTKMNHLERKGDIPKSRFKVEDVATIDIKSVSGLTLDKLTQISVLGKFKGNNAQTLEALKSGDLVLTKFIVTQDEMEKAVNHSSRDLKELIEIGSSARVVNEIFVVVEATLADKLEQSKNVEVKFPIKIVDVDGNYGGTTSRDNTITLSKGMCFAYGLLKPKWDARNKKNKTKVVDFNTDQWG